jgi:hypothetical protein
VTKLRDCRFRREFFAALSQRRDLAALAHPPSLHLGSSELVHVRFVRRPEPLRYQDLDSLADDLIARISEDRFRAVIEERDPLPSVDADDRVGGDSNYFGEYEWCDPVRH